MKYCFMAIFFFLINTVYSQCPPGTAPVGTNLVINGDFSLGDTGFNSSYIYGTGGIYGTLSNEGEYAIVNDPNDAHKDFTSFGDHTTGTGQMMVINGASNPNVNIWCQSITVNPNTTYLFSTWIATAFYANPAVLQFSVNGVNLSTPFSAPATEGVWQQFSATWFSGTNTTATICIVNQNTAIFGNDFALDDITFIECSCSTNITVSNDTIICPGGQAQLLATGASNYQWSPSISLNNPSIANPVATPQQTTTYTIIATQNGCSAIDTITVTVENIAANAGADQAICFGDTITLNATGGDTYQWSPDINLSDPNSATTLAFPLQDQTYLVSVGSNNCIATDTVQITVNQSPIVSAGSDTSVNNGTTVNLTGTPGNGTWSTSSETLCTGCTFFDMVVTESTTFYYYYKDQNGCDNVDSIYVDVSGYCLKPIFPNAFSPNNDGINDHFNPIILEGNNPVIVEWGIYNRWGNRIFSSDKIDGQWDGKFRDTEQPIGVFAYYLRYICNGEEKMMKGNVTLIR